MFLLLNISIINVFRILTKSVLCKISTILPVFIKLTFGVYYPDGSTTEEEHQLAGKHVHTITRYNADKVDHISDYLTMDHTWVN